MTLISTLRSRPHILRRKSKADDLSGFLNAIEKVRDSYPGYGGNSSLNLDDVLQKMEGAAAAWDWSDVKQGEVALVMQAVLSGDVPASSEVEAFLGREAAATTNSSLLTAVCQSYFLRWKRGTARTKQLARINKDRSQYLSKNWVLLFGQLPELLDAEDAPARLAERMILESDPYSWLKNCGVAAPHSGEIMKETHFAFLRIREARSVDDIARIFKWIHPVDRDPADHDWCAAAANTLLRPWVNSQPSSEVRHDLLSRLLNAYGDPRSGNKQFWPLVELPCRLLMVKWLAGKSMDALLRIITKSTKNHMWPPRHDFWKGLYDRGLIDEAWIALSTEASKNAQTMYDTTGDPIYKMAARQISSKRKETCLLVMRIGKLIVVEGSHDYRVHIHRKDSRPVSLLYRESYDAVSLTFSASDPDARIHDAYGGWRRWVEERVLQYD